MRWPSPPLPPVTRATAPLRSITGLLHAETVKPRRGAGEQIGLFRCRGAAREAFERVEQYRIATRPLVDREVDLEHAAARTEILDAGVDIGPPGIGHLSR